MAALDFKDIFLLLCREGKSRVAFITFKAYSTSKHEHVVTYHNFTRAQLLSQDIFSAAFQINGRFNTMTCQSLAEMLIFIDALTTKNAFVIIC